MRRASRVRSGARGRAPAALALLACAAAAVRGEAERGLDGYVARRFTNESGLPQGSVNALAQTPDGYLWIGTFGGLARFDGVRFRVFDVAGQPALPSSRVTALAVDRGGSLWVGTEDAGVVVGRDGRFEAPAAELPAGSVWAIAEGGDGALWVAADTGVARLAPGRATRYGTAHGLPSRWVRALAADARGRLWAGTPAGAARFERDRFVAVASPPVWALARAPAGDGLLAAGEAGLFALGDEGASPVAAGSEPLAPRALLVDRAGATWLGGLRLARRAPGAVALALDPGDRLGRDVKSLLEDREGGVWVGTEAHGLFELRARRARIVGREADLPAQSTLPIVEEEGGALLVGTLCGGLARFDGARFAPVAELRGDRGMECVSALAPARDGGVWVGARGVRKLGGAPRPEVVRAVGEPLVHALHEDADGTLWIGSTRGVERFTARGLEPVERLAGREAFAIVPLDPATLGFGLRGAVALLDADGVRRIELLRPEQARVPIRDLWRAPDGAVWAASYGAGLLRVGPGGEVRRVERSHGLTENFVSRLLPGGAGQLWLTGNRGIHRVALAELTRAATTGGRVVPLSLGARDGLEVVETNGGGQPAGIVRADGSLAVPTVRGVALVDAAPPPVRAQLGAVVFEEIVFAGRPLAPAPRLELPAAKERRLEVRYTLPTFGEPEQVRFRYRLAGADEAWQLDAGTRTALYTRLPPGRFRFEVEAFAGEGSRAASMASFELALAPRFVETPAFRGLAAAALAALALLAHRLRLSRLRRKRRELEQLVSDRTRELATLNSELERRVAQKTIEIRDTRDLAILTLARLAELRDGTTGEHLERIALFSRRLALALADGPFGRLSAEYIDELFRSSPLHDIGKVAIPDAILKKPGPLDRDEIELMRCHTTIGGDTLCAVGAGRSGPPRFLAMAAEIAYGHHERWDGLGYPRGLAGPATPLPARIVAVVDAYDAITSRRPYKPAFDHAEALRRVAADRGTHFEPVLVDALLDVAADLDTIRREHANPA
jgi:response regulator RpfG family c-di-GMP phosphodiesterase/ligand-binding sensor domain-containing protein